jgi:hypothetical protein
LAGSIMLATGGVLAAGTDPHWASTILLCGCEGTDGEEVSLDDESFANHANGAALGSGTDDALYKAGFGIFGSSSVYFDAGRNGFVRFADHADWTLSGDFTLEFFIYFHGAAQIEETSTIISQWNSTGNQRGWAIQYAGGVATNHIQFFASPDGTNTTILLDYNWTPSVDTFYYVCVERSGNNYRMYLGEPGGTAAMVASGTSAMSFFNSTAPLQLSGLATSEAECLRDVSLDEIRLTTVARYATDAGYPVPSTAFPRQ